MQFLVPKNWSNFQHYKNRNPPWIKLHRGCLMDPAFLRLDVFGRSLCPMLWILASTYTDGHIPYSIEDIAVVLRVTDAECLKGIKSLLDKGLFQIIEVDASTMQADASNLQADVCKTVPRVEERREEEETEERERRGEADTCSELVPISEPTSSELYQPEMIFPCVGNPKTWSLTQKLFDQIQEAYPDAPILDWIKKAKLWTETNTSKRKTAKGMPSFLSRWMATQTDRPAQPRSFQTNGKAKPDLQAALSAMPKGFQMPQRIQP